MLKGRSSLGLVPSLIRENWNMPKKFIPDFRDRAIRMVLDRQVSEGGPRAVSIRVVAQSLGCGPEILNIAAAFRQGTRPPHDEMIAFIDIHRDLFGVEIVGSSPLAATAPRSDA
jgi:transposase-like protein